MEWFNSLDTSLKIYWLIAGAASLVFIVQMILTFVGMDGSDGLSADFDGDMDSDGPFQFFSFRNLVNFLLGFGWGGVSFYNTFESKVWVGILALLTGLVFFFFFFFLMKQLMKLAKDNTFRINSTLDKAADVYLTIPGEKTGKGKIQISVNGAYHELDAMTEGEAIPTGSKIKVTQIIDNQTVLVIKL